MDGVLCVNKPKGFTSFDVIAKLRGITKTKRVGHAGTLDPLATGVLPVFLGRATRAIDLLPDHNKAYTADFILGIQTDTQDSTGQVCAVSSLRATSAQVRQALSAYQGEIVQMVPMFSAVHVGGRRLYQLAHQGDMTQDRPKRTVRVETIRLLQFDYQSQSGQVELACSSGTYVRTLLHDLGQDLGCGCIMTGLVRTKACGLTLAQSFTLEQLEYRSQAGSLSQALLPVGSLLTELPAVCLDQQQAKMFCNGVRLDLGRLPVQTWTDANYRVLGPNQALLGVARPATETGELIIRKVL